MSIIEELREEEHIETFKFLYKEPCDMAKARKEVRSTMQNILPVGEDFFTNRKDREIELEIKKTIGQTIRGNVQMSINKTTITTLEDLYSYSFKIPCEGILNRRTGKLLKSSKDELKRAKIEGIRSVLYSPYGISEKLIWLAMGNSGEVKRICQHFMELSKVDCKRRWNISVKDLKALKVKEGVSV